MSNDKQQQNEKGYQPQSDTPSNNGRFGYQPPESRNNEPSNVSVPPGDE